MTALRLIDAAGVEKLSMRKLAAELDVNPMSLYHHVHDRTDLLRGVCALVAAEVRLPPDDGAPWQDQLRALAHVYRSIARSHPSLWSHMNTHPDVVDQSGALWVVYNRILVAAGVPADRLAHTRTALFTFVSGFITAESEGLLAELAELAELDGVDDADATFAVAVDLIIAGLENGPSRFARP
ncbi:TetR/AcrR family transcriptional regulator [Streptosporangium sp. NPDC004379]|uniref:TetR/AcrR family transcriptional regulator n=1 Tax=Streptosporangium sp. NPDC004379 TaxID=3366189 RepID=UPI0036C928FB